MSAGHSAGGLTDPAKTAGRLSQYFLHRPTLLGMLCAILLLWLGEVEQRPANRPAIVSLAAR
ncbi:MAG: CRISPR-associated protein Cas5 [Mesorhizobium sp.]|nr:MAG: CRISPR-associated protein Cas5 [Mesorhizobium sp.]RWC94275.1 MAG: CRISPR-associated protein Cas5 [Mesorhizobium sp.]